MPEISPRVVDSTVVVKTGQQMETSKVAPTNSQPENKIATSEPKTPPQLDPRLVRMEKQNRQLARELQALKAAVTKPQEAPKPSFTAEDFKKQFLQDPTSVGLSYEELANAALDAPTPENQSIKALNKKILELEEKLTGTSQKIEESQTQAYQAALKQISREAESLVHSDESFELIKATKSVDAITQLIALTHKEEGYVMKVEDAAKDVEDYLTDEYTRIAKLRKIQSKLVPTEQQSSQQQQTSPAPKTPATTLTNRVNSSSASLSSKERRNRAVQMIEEMRARSK